MNLKELFYQLYKADTEGELDKIICGLDCKDEVSWYPYGGNESNFSTVENQQSSPVAALVEKITNSIDAILMRRCYEEKIDPKSSFAPKSIEEAVKQFFNASGGWNIPRTRGIQAESIQIIAKGPRSDTSLIIYDDGEGQHPNNFNATFLSFSGGNKNEIYFVQGKYNMGGSGAIVFCGKKKYQLVASKRFDNTGKFGFTIVRKHPLGKEEEKTKKNTWYEYLLINNEVPCFEIETLDLGLYKREFKTGTIIKLYSYKLPPGSKSVISRDLNQSINEYLFEPALPIYTIDNKDRYPDDANLERHLYGLKRRLEEDKDKEDKSKYIKEFFSESHNDSKIGQLKITVYIFNPRIDGRSAKDSKATIRREFFKNNMSVVFSLNGQVHANFRSEFITQSLKFNFLKDHLLIHVDCTKLNTSFRSELFMGSRDRLKKGEESGELRKLIASILTKGRLKEIYKEWKDSIATESGNADDLLKDYSKSLPIDKDLLKLLNNTFTIDKKEDTKEKKEKVERNKKNTKQPLPFNPSRFPSTFSIDVKSKDADNIPLTKIPIGGEKTIPFSTDVEDQYFDRAHEPGELKIAFLGFSSNQTKGGTEQGQLKDIESLIDVSVSSPNKGKIRVNIKPTKQAHVDDAIKVKATLTSPNGDIKQIFKVQILDNTNKQQKAPKKSKQEDNSGLPPYTLVCEYPKEGYKCWEDLDFFAMDYKTIMYPFVEGDKLERIYINMDSSVLKNYKSPLTSEEQVEIAHNRYISVVYFHTLFLYIINKGRKYQFQKIDEFNSGQEVDLGEYLKDIFDSNYADFLLKFGIGNLMDGLGD